MRTWDWMSIADVRVQLIYLAAAVARNFKILKEVKK